MKSLSRRRKLRLCSIAALSMEETAPKPVWRLVSWLVGKINKTP